MKKTTIVFLILFGFLAPAFTQVPKGNYFGESWDVVIRTHWNYEVASHQRLDEPECPALNPVTLNSSMKVVLARDFVDYKLIKAVVPGQSPIYEFQIGRPDFLDVQQWDYSEILESPFFRCQCRPKKWEETTPVLFLPPILPLNPKGDFAGINPGIEIFTSCRCHYKAKKIPYCDPDAITRQEVPVKPYDLDGKLNYLFEQEPFNKLFFITPKDLETLIKEGYWKKTFTEVRPMWDIPSSLEGTEGLPTDILIDPSTHPWDPPLAYQVELVVEILAEPRIHGPHYLAQPFYTIQPTTNDITLQVDPIPGWQVSKIKPIGGWEKAREFVHKADEEGPPKPSLTLEPASPGKVSFEIDWVSPKGKKGKSPPFEVTVVLLEFKRVERCEGYDDTLNFSPRVHAASLCEQKTKRIEIEITPAGTAVTTELRPQNQSAFGASPPIFSNFPQEIVLNGYVPRETSLAAFIEVEEGKWQKAAELLVDVLTLTPLKVLPVTVYTPLNIAPMDVGGLFRVALDDMTQACKKIEQMATEHIDPTTVPGYTDGDVVDADSGNWRALVAYANQHFAQGREVTAFFVPDIQSAAQPNMVGFYNKETRSMFVEAYSGLPHLLAHEIGHHVFGKIYPESERRAHTKDSQQLMYQATSNNCEIRLDEWRLRD